MFGAAVMAGAAIYSAYQQHKAGKAQARQAAWLAKQREKQAEKLMERARFNVEQLELEGKQYGADVMVKSAGTDGMSLDLIDMSALHSKIADTQNSIMEDAEWEAEQIRIGAENTKKQGALNAKAADRQAFGTLLSGGASVASKLSKN